ncbi:MAG: O-antigen ligase domain-containing protein, partial [Mesorhizobium sp.]
TVLSIVFLSARSRLSGISILMIFIGLSVYTIGAWSRIDAREVDPAFGRGEFARTTVEGIKDNWATGVGFGNFQKAYQIYEKEGMIFSKYVNHAHNDYLEIAFEGGAPAILLMIFYFILLFIALSRIRRHPLQKAAFLSVSFLLIHSLVDYPLRTEALAMTFAYMNAIIFHNGFAARLAQKNELIEVDHNGGKLFVPIATSS